MYLDIIFFIIFLPHIMKQSPLNLRAFYTSVGLIYVWAALSLKAVFLLTELLLTASPTLLTVDLFEDGEPLDVADAHCE